MKIVVIGGTGLVGSKLVRKLAEHGHDAVAASPGTGVNTLTGEGLAEVLEGAQVVVDVSNSPSFEDGPVLEFFRTSTGNLLTAEAAAGVGHHVALSVVGTDRLAGSGYFRAKIAQEKLIRESGMPYSIVHATQFFEFVPAIAQQATEGGTVRLSSVSIQPIASDDVATAMGRTAVGTPVNGVVEIAGPTRYQLDELVRKALATLGDPREVVTDVDAGYYGTAVEQDTLVPGEGATIFETHYEDWLAQNGN
ncbi:SDR family oxidoreductase [Amycolatopsis sp.]|jgi:uncharacterized protein YbjT (DUF2867 family)|uniref:SDR family oxidoreductase n=1 Tax=Amycolatopsis sp. TaxID=37632 RepID=UPI002E054D8B|nr:SDR family oxidoreductase [Amycolatopsis sp.]